MKAYVDHRSERPQLLSLGRFDLDALIRACLGLRARVPERRRVVQLRDLEPHPDFEDTVPAARAAMTPLP